VVPAGWFDEVVAAWAASDPKGLLRRPNGWLVDYRQVWLAGKATYDPSAIRAPTLLAIGEWDGLTPLPPAQDLFARLAVPRKRLVIVGEGSHQLMMERNRLQLFREVQLFLDEPSAP